MDGNGRNRKNRLERTEKTERMTDEQQRQQGRRERRMRAVMMLQQNRIREIEQSRNIISIDGLELEVLEYNKLVVVKSPFGVSVLDMKPIIWSNTQQEIFAPVQFTDLMNFLEKLDNHAIYAKTFKIGGLHITNSRISAVIRGSTKSVEFTEKQALQILKLMQCPELIGLTYKGVTF